jgi:hypothetical protein
MENECTGKETWELPMWQNFEILGLKKETHSSKSWEC